MGGEGGKEGEREEGRREGKGGREGRRKERGRGEKREGEGRRELEYLEEGTLN